MVLLHLRRDREFNLDKVTQQRHEPLESNFGAGNGGRPMFNVLLASSSKKTPSGTWWWQALPVQICREDFWVVAGWLGARLKGRIATHASKKGLLRERGSKKGSQEGSLEGDFQKALRTPFWRVCVSRHVPKVVVIPTDLAKQEKPPVPACCALAESRA